MQSAEEALLAIEHGVSVIGLVSAMPSGSGPIPEERKVSGFAGTARMAARRG